MVHYDNLDLTHLEKTFLEAFINDLYAEPGFSDINPKDMATAMKKNIKTVKGVMGSLVKKNIIWTMSAEDLGIPRENGPIIYLNESYYFLHPEWASEGKTWKTNEDGGYEPLQTFHDYAKEIGTLTLKLEHKNIRL